MPGDHEKWQTKAAEDNRRSRHGGMQLQWVREDIVGHDPDYDRAHSKAERSGHH